MTIRAVLLDMDGTLFLAPVDWRRVRRAMGIPNDGRPILDHLRGLPQGKRLEGERILAAHEAEAVCKGRLRPGARELLSFLRGRGIPTALVTNNSRTSAEEVLRRYGLAFDLVVTRDDGVYKPHPEALLLPLRLLGVPPEEAALVGDSHLDLLAAHRAGVRKVILVSPPGWVREHFPTGARFHEAQDLYEARSLLAELLAGGDLDLAP